MKKVIFIISIIIGLCGCFRREEYSYTNNFIAAYIMYDDDAYMVVEKNCDIGFCGGGYHTYWNRTKYEPYAEKFGDISYNRTLNSTPGCSHFPSSVWALSFVVTSIDIVSNASWDATHDAGISLSDCFSVRFRSIAPYIKSGYNDELLDSCKSNFLNIPINTLQSNDMFLTIGMPTMPSFHICATSPPTIDKHHRLTITLTLDDGSTKEHTVEVTYP